MESAPLLASPSPIHSIARIARVTRITHGTRVAPSTRVADGVIGALAALGALVATAACAAPAQRFEFTRPALGTELRIVCFASDAALAVAAADAAFERVAVLEQRLSDWRGDSEVAALARAARQAPAGPLRVSDDLWRALARGVELAELSDGAFDPTIGPLVMTWRRARRQGELPEAAALAAARAATGFRKLELDPAAQTVTFLAPGMQLDFGGIGKGQAADAALAVLREHGLERALVVAGGDVVAGAPPPGEDGWIVALAESGADGEAPPQRALRVAHAAVSTSGDLHRFVELDGRRFSHVVDPATGLGLESRRLVTAIASDGITADALATAASVLEPARALELAERIPGAAVRVVELDFDPPRPCASSRWPPMMPAPAAAPSRSDQENVDDPARAALPHSP